MIYFTDSPLERLMMKPPVPAGAWEWGLTEMYKLIVAEKPSVAVSIAEVMGISKRHDGYIEGKDYIVSWCFGHLAEFAEPDTYDERYGKWRYDDLPIIPEAWQYSIGRDRGKQFSILNTLFNRSDICEVINACDAGREGELIFRTVYQLSSCTKPMKRLWISSLEESEIRKGLENLKDGSEYNNLYKAALCRAKADWLVGINATRLFSILYHRTLNVGRVVSPTLALVVQREYDIESFKPEPFYTVNLIFDGFTAVSERFRDKAEAENILELCKNSVPTVKSIERKEKSENPPLLYDLVTLQREANRNLGYTAQQTLDYLQSLYEKKLCTYPRTDSRYLTDDMKDTLLGVIHCSSGICGVDSLMYADVSKVCDSEKVSDHCDAGHHAIIPTMHVSNVDLSSIPEGERGILEMTANRLLMAVSKPYRYAETVAAIDCGGISFTAKGRTILDMGWKIYQDKCEPSIELPDLVEGIILETNDILMKESFTSPPKPHTEDSLLSSMERAGNPINDETSVKKGIGTAATRAAVIEKLISGGFVERKTAGKTVSLVPTHTGISMIAVLPEQLRSPVMTSEWEYKLNRIEQGELSPDEFMSEITNAVKELINTYEVIRGSEVLFPSGRTVVGKCPRCGGDVTESRKGYFCERNDCKFGIWRDNRFMNSKKISLNGKVVNGLLSNGRTYISGIYSEKTGKTYDAYVRLIDDGKRTEYKIEFEKEDK